MDSFYRAPPPSDPPSSMPRQSKMISQRHYRANEGECFNTLQDIIKELSGEEPQTRRETLEKAIHLLATTLEVRKSQEVLEAHPTMYGARVLTNSGNTTSAHMGYPTEPSFPHQSWQPMVDFKAHPTYVLEPHVSQQYHTALDMDSILNQASSSGYDQAWPHQR